LITATASHVGSTLCVVERAVRTGVRIGFSLVKLRVETKLEFLGETEMDPDEEHGVHEARRPAGHSFRHAASEFSPLTT